ncbi:cytochrome b5-like [Hyposmocoma kahamanoa]|uniref:cytochrome b5-like n=1 Tax=Hyposmocoma kahamanoa TaxID=1477025 RepID=UPI000E6D96A9|nr:cytochrome b5-like [Hyposmocoma kahamanoa]
MNRYKRAEVAKHNGKKNTQLWIVVKDIVYDVSTHITEHIGGEDPLLEVGGTDATKDFAHHSSAAYAKLAQYKIGEIVEAEKYYDANGKLKDGAQAGRGCTRIVTCGLIG